MRRRYVPDPVAELPDGLRRCTGDSGRWWRDVFAWAELAGVDSVRIIARVRWADGALEVGPR